MRARAGCRNVKAKISHCPCRWQQGTTLDRRRQETAVNGTGGDNGTVMNNGNELTIESC